MEAGAIPTVFEIRNDWNECLRFFEKNTYHERYDNARSSGEGIATCYEYRRQYYHKKRTKPEITKSDITYTGLNTVSDISNIEFNGCTLAIQPVDVSAGTYMHREIELDLSIDAEIK